MFYGLCVPWFPSTPALWCEPLARADSDTDGLLTGCVPGYHPRPSVPSCRGEARACGLQPLSGVQTVVVSPGHLTSRTLGILCPVPFYCVWGPRRVPRAKSPRGLVSVSLLLSVPSLVSLSVPERIQRSGRRSGTGQEQGRSPVEGRHGFLNDKPLSQRTFGVYTGPSRPSQSRHK